LGEFSAAVNFGTRLQRGRSGGPIRSAQPSLRTKRCALSGGSRLGQYLDEHHRVQQQERLVAHHPQHKLGARRSVEIRALTAACHRPVGQQVEPRRRALLAWHPTATTTTAAAAASRARALAPQPSSVPVLPVPKPMSSSAASSTRAQQRISPAVRAAGTERRRVFHLNETRARACERVREKAPEGGHGVARDAAAKAREVVCACAARGGHEPARVAAPPGVEDGLRVRVCEEGFAA
jgi:hypothetical protein